jgi:hypothetical protein
MASTRSDPTPRSSSQAEACSAASAGSGGAASVPPPKNMDSSTAWEMRGVPRRRSRAAARSECSASRSSLFRKQPALGDARKQPSPPG